MVALCQVILPALVIWPKQLQIIFIPISVANINSQHTINVHIYDLQDEYNFSYRSVSKLSEVG